MNRWDFLTLIGALLTTAGAAMVYVPAGNDVRAIRMPNQGGNGNANA